MGQMAGAWRLDLNRNIIVHLDLVLGGKGQLPSVIIVVHLLDKTCRIQNPDIPRACRGGAAHGGAAGWSGAG